MSLNAYVTFSVADEMFTPLFSGGIVLSLAYWMTGENKEFQNPINNN
jgi:hypothetical protein